MYIFYKFLFIIFISTLISSCHEKDYDIIYEAKKLISDSNNKREIEKKENTIVNNSLDTEKKEAIKSNKKIKENKKTQKTQKKSRILKKIESENKEQSVQSEVTDGLNQKNNLYIEKIIKVGIMLPLTGEHKNIGNIILNAIEMAIFQKEDNNIQLLIKDTEAKPEVAKKVFLELINEDVGIVIGPLFSKTLAAMQGLSDANNINIFALTNNKNLAKKGIWVFGIDPQAQTKRVLKFALDEGAKKIAALLPKNAYGLLLFDTILNFSRDNLVDVEKIEFYDVSIKSQRNAAKKIAEGFDEYQKILKSIEEDDDIKNIEETNLLLKKPFDSVFIAATRQNLTILSSQLQYNNVDPTIVQYLGIASWEDKSILNEPALEGGIFATTSQLYQKKIKAIYKKSFNKEMPKIAMIAYDILALLSLFDTEGNSIETDQMINDEGYLGLRGLFRLKENGIVERTFDLKQVKNKKFRVYEKAKSEFLNF